MCRTATTANLPVESTSFPFKSAEPHSQNTRDELGALEFLKHQEIVLHIPGLGGEIMSILGYGGQHSACWSTSGC